ncbi:tumor necrosis factor receptor superfamily member 6 isoform X1 [Platichthys flesus]|uniref:tumor necrosis factor receptor superfamily member 6 isoform X1 n=1 Tax=Platichthys flesus TaxID=8260 RepID=UPI002DB7BC0D|nr:tumor necrosis factor receptor superfamily member 6 isoform X1 [Platichthys flesus]
MASEPNQFPRWVFTCVLIFSHVSLAFSSASPQTEEDLSERVVRGPVRSRRQACPYGTYEHEGWTCCLCGAGQQVKTHCTAANQTNGKCEACDPDTYNSHATAQEFCEPCTSCIHPNANLEVAENCTRTSNAKCRCKNGHYCDRGPETCKVCNPCKECGSEGVGVACTATNNTVCNAITEGVSGGAIAGIVIAILLPIAMSVGVALWYRRRGQSYYTHQPSPQTNGNVTEVELQPLNELRLQHVPDIAGVLGWKDMQDVAMRSGMTKVEIDSCRLVDPTDPVEQTTQLLSKWVEMQGNGGATKLVELLQNSRKKDKAEKVAEILRSDSPAPSDDPV